MQLPTREAGTVSYEFLSTAAHYFYTAESWQDGIGNLLNEICLAAGAEFVMLLQCHLDSREGQQQIEVLESWYSRETGQYEQHFIPCKEDESRQWLTMLGKGQPVIWESCHTESFWPGEIEKFGLKAYAAFPVFAEGLLWGILCFEFKTKTKTWTPEELKVVEGVAGLLGRAIEKELTDMAIRMDKTYFEELFHGSPAAIVILSQEGIVERVNREFTNLFQYEPEEIIGHRIDDFLPSGPDRENANLLTDRVRDGERVAHEGVRYRKDGKPVYVSTIGVQSVPMAEGPVIYSIYHDITERVIAQEKLRESQARFKLLFESANDAIILLKEGIVVECNARSLGIFRCKREELVGHSAIELSPARQPNGVPSLNLAVKYDRAAQDKEHHSFEWMHKRPDGSTFMAEVSISRFEWKSETYSQAIVRDISQRKKTEELLHQRYDFIAFLSRVSADLINLDSSNIDSSVLEVLSYSGAYTACSRAMVFILSPDNTYFTPVFEWSPVEGNAASGKEMLPVTAMPGMFQALSAGEVITGVPENESPLPEIQFLKDLFTRKLYRSFILIPLSVRSRLIGFTGYMTEKQKESWTEDLITPLKLTNQMIANAIERSRIEQELKDAKERAEESDKLKTAFLSSMSHEIRTPMNHILGFIELLKDPSLSEKDKEEFMSIVRTSGNVLLRLIDDILDIAKIDSGQLTINPVEIQLKKFIDDIYFYFNEQLKRMGKNKIDFTLVGPILQDGFSIKVDPLRVQQIISNLMSNAIKFTQEGTITLGYSVSVNHSLSVYVEDTGIGIPREKHDQIFERFRQLDSSYAREYSGTGLGLAITKGLIQLMKGEISLTSERGKGSRFTFTIPYAPVGASSEPVIVRYVNSSDFNFSGKTILVVEDDEVNYRFLEIVINRTRAKSLRAASGKEAVDLAFQQDVDLILMDIQIPVIDGYEATRQIKKQKPDIPVIAQTAHALEEERTKCLDSGADDYISKPINRKDLLAKMSALLIH